MSSDLHRTIAAIGEGFARPAPIAPPSKSRAKAREIIDQNPGATLVEIVALAWLEGRIDGLREGRDTFATALFRDTADTCQRCGRKHRGTVCTCNEERQP